MSSVIMQSIHHEHAENILKELKGYEMRKTAPSGGAFPYTIYVRNKAPIQRLGRRVVSWSGCRSRLLYL